MRKLLSLVAVLVVFGCHKDAPAPADSTTPPAAVTKAPAGGGGGGIAPIGSGAVGGMTPVAGSESVEGSGMGGIGQAAKNQARKAASGAGAPAPLAAGGGDTTGE